ncbi:hypothetical protein BOO69_13010 [Sulfitobacter alexandrii]|uniref:EF-hand domain-containing protein n=1 Tax=Sulfitobacter alexandrii TaxID=1917485 RepID=A0A1J0WJ68_9RHOB|nr:EF-hand domain-containing protein [Sulfitobacter alexandrii]APE44216.1 hypothetical protein BOO69_13010 [Sulfitobacter alexandrii]
MTYQMSLAAAVAAGISLTGAAQAQNTDDSSVCNDGYSMTDVDDNGYVSPIEMKAYTEKAMGQMDADQSGTVDKDEFVNCNNVLSGTQSASADRTERHLAALDLNDDGSISLDEYMKASADTYNSAKDGDKAAATDAANLIFIPADAEQSDVTTMSRNEYSARSGLMFIALDTDQDNALTKEEFMEKAPPMVDISETLNREFDEMDADGSGDLTTTEMIAANQKRADDAMKNAEMDSDSGASDKGAPVVYYSYPHTM